MVIKYFSQSMPLKKTSRKFSTHSSPEIHVWIISGDGSSWAKPSALRLMSNWIISLLLTLFLKMQVLYVWGQCPEGYLRQHFKTVVVAAVVIVVIVVHLLDSHWVILMPRDSSVAQPEYAICPPEAHAVWFERMNKMVLDWLKCSVFVCWFSPRIASVSNDFSTKSFSIFLFLISHNCDEGHIPLITVCRPKACC